jgi:Fic family protein
MGSDSALAAAVTTVMRAAAFETGAIERLYETDRGLTLSVATEEFAWELGVKERGADALKLFEAQLEAYELADLVATEDRPVTEVWIRQLHEIVTAPQETYAVLTQVGLQRQLLPKGRYKQHPNHVRLVNGDVHVYAPSDQTPSEMARLVVELQSAEFVSAHPVLQCSYAHYCLVAIHPFADGNGRVTRAVASTYLTRAASVPLLVLSDQRDDYFRTLARADQGDAVPFIDFVGEGARSAITMVIDAVRTANAPRPEASLDSLRRLLLAQGGLTHQELGAVAIRLVGEIASRIHDHVEALELPPGVSGSSSAGATSGGVQRPGFLPIPAEHPGHLVTNRIFVNLASAPPADAQINDQLEVLISASKDEAETFLVASEDTEASELVLGLREVYPELTVAANYRLDAFAQRLLGERLAALVEQASASLDRSGYRLAGLEAMVRSGDLAIPIEPNSLIAYLRGSDIVDRLSVAATEAAFILHVADPQSLEVLSVACAEEAFSTVADLDAFLSSASSWSAEAFRTLRGAQPNSEWRMPLPFLVAALIWIGGSGNVKQSREAIGADEFFWVTIDAARAALRDS